MMSPQVAQELSGYRGCTIIIVLISFILQKHQRPIEKLVKYMIDVSMGMHYLSERGLVHRVSMYSSLKILTTYY